MKKQLHAFGKKVASATLLMFGFALVLVFVLACAAALHSAKSQDMLVVQNCGTLPQQYPAGSTQKPTVDVNGRLCSNVMQNLGILNVANFGPLFQGGDDAAIIQLALNQVTHAGAKVYFPCGTYNLNSQINGNGFAVVFEFAGGSCTVMNLNHTGFAFNMVQSDVGNPFIIEGDVVIQGNAASISAGCFNISFPAIASFAQPTFDMPGGHISCLSTSAVRAAPYPNTIKNGVTLTGAWYGNLNVWYQGPQLALVGGHQPYVSGSTGIVFGDGTFGVQVNELFVKNAETSVLFNGYTEGISFINPITVNGTWGIKVGNAANSGCTYSGSSGIIQRGGFNANQIEVYGGSITAVRAAIFSDGVNNITFSKTLLYNYDGDGVNPFTGVFIYNSLQSTIDLVATGVVGNQSGSSGVVLALGATYALVYGSINSLQTGIIGCPSSSNNKADIIPYGVATNYTDAGSNNHFSFYARGKSIIQTQTVSAAASIAFTGLPANFQSFELKCVDISGAASATFRVQFGTGAGPTYDVAGYQWAFYYNQTNASAYVGSNNAADSAINIGPSTNTAVAPVNIEIHLHDIGITQPHSLTYDMTAQDPTQTFWVNVRGMGVDTNTTAITAVRLIPSSGTITGTCSLYGNNS